jgi:hypothetical protein
MKAIFGWMMMLTMLLCVRAAAQNERPELQEARLRARLLHETIHGSLQVMHRDFFKEGEHLPIPSESLEDVFSELWKTWKVEVKWIAVTAQAMNVDHRARTDFEKQAVKTISEGREMAEAMEGATYRYAGAITLGNRCLKCHVPDRSSLEDRKAALVISMPLKLEPARPVK